MFISLSLSTHAPMPCHRTVLSTLPLEVEERRNKTIHPIHPTNDQTTTNQTNHQTKQGRIFSFRFILEECRERGGDSHSFSFRGWEGGGEREREEEQRDHKGGCFSERWGGLLSRALFEEGKGQEKESRMLFCFCFFFLEGGKGGEEVFERERDEDL